MIKYFLAFELPQAVKRLNQKYETWLEVKT